MLTAKPFYHGVIRKTTIAFGALFNSISIVNNDAKGKNKKIVLVPIAYAAKDKYITRLRQDPDISKQKEISLPRMSFEMMGVNYDTERKLNKINKVKSDTGETFQYTPVPYILQFELSTYTKTTEDNLQIMEQILPYFTPDFTLSVKMLENPDIIQDIPISLMSVDTTDLWEGQFDDQRMILTTYSFSVKVNLYGPVFGLGEDYANKDHFGTDTFAVIKRVIVDVNPNSARYRVEVDPFTADKTNDYVAIEVWKEGDENL